jgi:hypothetical protein
LVQKASKTTDSGTLGRGGGITCILGPFHVLALLEGDVEFLVRDEELDKKRFVRRYTV